MVNSRDSLSKIPSMNNDAKPYIITLDVYKEGYWAYDISNYYKGRVDDNGTPFQVRWFEHGQIKNVQGLRPFIRGTVGQHTIDDETDPDNPKVVPSPDCSQIDQTGETTDTMPGGIAVYRMVNQCFTQEGMFYGEIGLKDSSGLVLSSVDIAFKVLGGRMNMVGARKFYVSEFEKAFDNLNAIIEKTKKDFSQQLSQVITDARNTYNTQVKNSQDALNALNGEIRANRQEQANLSQRLVGTEQQIAEHDVVTRPEFLNLSNQLTQQVSQMKEAELEFFNTADDLKAKYPQGANKLCVTLNDSHEWVYDFANNQWNDAGAFNYGTLDPKLTTAIYQKNPNNLIVNSDFYNLDLWNAARDGGVEPNCYISTDDKANNSNVLVMNGFVKDGTSNESWIKTNDIPLSNNTAISVGADLQITGINDRVGDSAGMDITWLDKDKNILSYSHYKATPANDGSFRKYLWENIQVYPGATCFEIAFNIYGEGCIKIKRPHANYGSSLLPYVDENLKFNIQNWQLTTDGSTHTQFENDLTVMNGDGDMGHYSYLSSPIFWLKRKTINIEILGKSDWQYGTGEAYLEIREFTADEATQIADGFNPSTIQDLQIPKGDKAYNYKFNHIELNPNTVAVVFRLVVRGNVTLQINSFTVTSSLQPAELLTYDNTFIAKALTLQNDMYNINTIPLKTETNQYYYTKTKISPVVNKKFKVSILAQNTVQNDHKLIPSRVYLEVDQYSNSETNSVNRKLQINKEILPSTDLKKHTFEIELDKDTKYYTIGITILNNVNVNFKDWKIDFIKSTKTNEVANLVIPAYDFASPDKVDFNKNSVKLAANNLDQNQWSMSDTRYYRVIPGSIISLTTLAESTADNAELEINQHTDLVSSIDSKLNIDVPINTKGWEQVKAENIKLDQSTNFISFRIAFSGNGSIEIGKIKLWYSNHIPDTSLSVSQLPQMNILSDAMQISDKWVKSAFIFDDKGRTINGYLQFAMQGDSSKNYPKKNLKIKCFKDSDCKTKLKWRPKSGWDKNNKFNLKANYIDATQARNLVNASIFAKATAITPFAFKDHENLAKSQNLGQMEGFPIELYFNYQYYGLMTLNTKKDDKPFGLDSSNPKEEAIVNDTVYSNVFGDSTKTIDGTAFETTLQDKASDTLNTNFANFEKFVGTSTDDDFKQHLADYIDVNSVINAYLFGNLSRMFDFANKSIILLTWDEGKTYYLTLYDLDSTWGLYWNGSQLNSHPEAWSLDPKNPGNSITMVDGSEAQSNSLYRRLYKLFKPEIKAQYEYLRKNVWSNAQIISVFKEFIHAIPEEAYEREQEKWADIPSKDITDFAQIQQSIITRGNAMDEYMSKLVPEADPLEDIKARLTNLEHNGTTK